MSQPLPTVPAPLPARRTALVAGAAAALGALLVLAALGVAGLVSGGRDDGERVRAYVAPHGAFAVVLPDGWGALSRARAAALPSQPLAVLRRADGRALVTVRETAPPRTRDPRALASGLTRALRRRFPDLQPVAARMTPVRGGSAFVYTFARRRSGTVQTVALARAGRRTFALDAVAPADAPDAAREIAAMIATFGAP